MARSRPLADFGTPQAAGYDDHVVRGDPPCERFAVLYYRGGSLRAVGAVNSVADYLSVRKTLARGATIPPERAADPGTPLKCLVVPA